MDAIYHRTHLGDSLLHALQQLCVAGELEGAEARRIITDFNQVLKKIRKYVVLVLQFGDKPLGIKDVRRLTRYQVPGIKQHKTRAGKGV